MPNAELMQGSKDGVFTLGRQLRNCVISPHALTEGSRTMELLRIDNKLQREGNGGSVAEVDGVQVSRNKKLCVWVYVNRVGRAWLCCGLIGHPAESPAFSCLTLNFSGKLSLLFFVCVCVCLK